MDISFIQSQIDNCKGLCVELGGPSPGGYKFLQELGLKLPPKIQVTNKTNPVVLNSFGENPETYAVDDIVDIHNLPYKKGEVDLILTSSLPHKLHIILFENAPLILRNDGLLIVENEQPNDIKIATKVGFKPLLDKKTAKKYYSQIYQFQ